MTTRWLDELMKDRLIYLDGATGSNLQAAGMPAGVCPELWILEHPEVLIDLQQRFVNAGSRILYAPTFSANRVKLKKYGLEDQTREMNRRLVAISKEAANGLAYVAGDMTMTGAGVEPLGTLTVDELHDIYTEQALALYEAGVDLFIVETMMSLQEAKICVQAIHSVCDLPVFVTMTFDESGRTLYGTDPATAVVALQSLGIDAVGINCSAGPDRMHKLIREMKEYAKIPLIAKPNAGLPVLVDGKTKYDMAPEEFAKWTRKLVLDGANIIGGCCGCTPEHISALVEQTKDIEPLPAACKYPRTLASERKVQVINPDGPFVIIGERINPTGKRLLQESLLAGDMDIVLEMAKQQEAKGAEILDVNVGMNGVDEKAVMVRAIREISLVTDLPLCIDSSYVDVIEAALKVYPGRALINSVSLEKEKIERLLPLAKKYGAMFILLPLSEAGLPKNFEEKKDNIHKILEKAFALGLTADDVIADGLVETVGANPNAALEFCRTVRYCHDELGLCTTGGLSNVSFGLPQRPVINSAFATMAIQAGLTTAILNPESSQLVDTCLAGDLLKGKPEANTRYISRMTPHTEKIGSGAVYKCVLEGKRSKIKEAIDEQLSAGVLPEQLLENEMISAINDVGTLFEKQQYFLPQLIAGAETMRIGIDYLEPMLSAASDRENKATIVIATVEGDIHDIGKNLVAMMLKNYGYNVIDLGIDQPAEAIVEKAMETHAEIIALSALMTTTMQRMRDVAALVKERGLNARVIIGGAVITQSYADEIGADGYSKDATEAVKLVQRLLGR
ncbi:MAG: homocysteine S-methyltransferase family protein [Parasporobacterium sp.]|nr:homocysteine S-methyltransferase family protein [Parasporobacterium sp.]